MLIVRTARRGEWPTAARLLAAHLPRRAAPGRADQLVRLLVSGEIDPAGLLVAESAGELIGAILSQVTEGGVGSLLPPTGPHAGLLIAAALGRFRQLGIGNAQCLVDRRETPDCDALEAAGFRAPSDLLTLTRPVGPSSIGTQSLELVPFAACDRAEVERIAAASFRDSPDFPELNEHRTVSEWLAGQAWAFEAGGWLARLGGQAVGLGIATSASRGESAELVYLGLSPESRGRGLGHELLAALLAEVSGVVVTGVDARNLAARRVYERAGFRETAVRAVYLWDGNARATSPLGCSQG